MSNGAYGNLQEPRMDEIVAGRFNKERLEYSGTIRLSGRFKPGLSKLLVLVTAVLFLPGIVSILACAAIHLSDLQEL